MSRFSVKIKSINPKYDAVLKKYKKQLEDDIARSGNLVRNTAIKSIHAHQSSGITYGKHTASRPGFPPNTDTGHLASNIYVKIDNDKLGVSVESRANYSQNLEFGTSKMDARPFMQPALEENRNKIKRLFKNLRSK